MRQVVRRLTARDLPERPLERAVDARRRRARNVRQRDLRGLRLGVLAAVPLVLPAVLLAVACDRRAYEAWLRLRLRSELHQDEQAVGVRRVVALAVGALVLHRQRARVRAAVLVARADRLHLHRDPLLQELAADRRFRLAVGIACAYLRLGVIRELGSTNQVLVSRATRAACVALFVRKAESASGGTV